MTREDILKIAKPILFNTDMTQAVLDNSKTATRRIVKPRYKNDEYGWQVVTNKASGMRYIAMTDEDGRMTRYMVPPYQPGNHLYVRETWSPMYPNGKSNDIVGYMYRADDGMDVSEYDRRYPNSKDYQWSGVWRPAIHMPKDAARLFLKVTNVKVERLQEITVSGLQGEGLLPQGWLSQYEVMSEPEIFEDFKRLWDSTIKPKDRGRYGWEANPWVWLIEFERVFLDETA